MPVKFIGRKSHFRGNTLFWLAANLKDLGVGRVLTRTKEEVYPEKCYYRITKVIPDFSHGEMRRGEVWAQQVHRGLDVGEVQLNSGQKKDWKLIPKEDEKDFCQIEEVYEPPKLVTKLVDFPPLMGVLIQKEKKLKHKPLLKMDVEDRVKGINYEEFIRQKEAENNKTSTDG